MKTYKFKTNINCNGCISKVSSNLNDLVGENNWVVDIKDKDKILTVNTEKDQQAIETAVKSLGFNIERKKEGLFSGLFK